ncbi:MAG: TonB-dependent receptor [bacterium]|nr:TonB-dependent receptor [bacterium]
MTRKTISGIVLAALLPLQLWAGVLRGMVHDQDTGEILIGATAMLEGTQRGAATNPKGWFTINNLAAGNYKLRVSMIGFEDYTQDVALTQSDTLEIHMALAPGALELGEVNIEAERQRSGLDNTSTVRREVIPGEELRERSTDGKLMSALAGKTGIRTKPCALCGSMGVGMQGLDPSYTEVNVDGMPVLSGLGTLYGMDGLSVSDVKELQVTKGSGSNLFGSGAIAGAINLVSVKPARAKTLAGSISANNNAQNTLSLSASGLTGKLPMRISLLNSAEPNIVDEDNNGLTDTPKYRRFSGQIGVSPILPRGELRLGGRLYDERRFAGETNWNKSYRGSAEVYGREIYTKRSELSARYDAPSSGSFHWSIEGASAMHDHDSWYGTAHYSGEQTLILGKFSSQKTWNDRHSTVGEIAYNHEEYDDDLAVATKTDFLYDTPGLTLEHTMQLASENRLTLQGGSKVEYWNDYGTQVIPRGTLLWRPDLATGVRLSGGAGFRPVSIFSSEEALMSGFADVTVPTKLEPERSVAGSLALNRQWVGSTTALSLDVSTFYTYFSNKLILRNGHMAGSTIYINSDFAYSAGTELQGTFTTTSGWTFDAGGRFSQVRYEDEHAEMRNAEFQNQYTLNFGLRKDFARSGITAEVSNAVYGPQFLPEGRGREKSPDYVIWDLGLSKSWKAVTLAASVKNLFDWTQPDDPYLRDAETDHLILDSSLIYGPLLGRTAALSLSWRWNEK